MCGLTAFTTMYKNGFAPVEQNAAAELLWLTQLRGIDSTGVALVDDEGDTQVVKELGPPQRLMVSKAYKDWDDHLLKSGLLMFGHCRATTRGETNVDNAHPFEYTKANGTGKIILAHNGTLDFSQQLPRFHEFKVDSEWLAYTLAQNGAEETFSKVEGPIATIWYDTEDKTLNLYRNDERPLYYFITTGGQLVVNSARENLLWLATRHGLQVKGMIAQVQADTWMKFDGPIFSVPEEKEVKFKERKWSPGFHSSHHTHYSPSYAASDAYHKLTRSYTDDIQHLFDGSLVRIEWVPERNQRLTTDSTGVTRYEYQLQPYRPNLQKMEIDPADKTTIIETVIDENGVIQRNRYKKKGGEVATNPTPLRSLDEGTSSKELAFNNLKYKKGKKIHWKTKQKGGNSLTHHALCSYENERLFTEYGNNEDGVIKRDDVVTIELAEVLPSGAKMLRGYGFRLKEKGDVAIEYTFIGNNLTKEEMLGEQYWRGTVVNIRINEKSRYNSSGSVVSVFLRNCIPIVTAEPVEAKNDPRLAKLLH